MKIVRDPAQLMRPSGSIGFVPTMGYLHDGHLALIKAARSNDHVVVSIFVNPMQFAPTEDLSRYPRDEVGDLAKCEKAGVDTVFLPAPADMYPPGFETEVRVKETSQGLCGASRPLHFAGVATVVLKLFNLVQPSRAYFGEKDYQQLSVIKAMVRDLAVPVEVIGVPTLREPDGLAMSSRNVYLSATERQDALILKRTLDAVAASKGSDAEREALGRTLLAGVNLDYFTVRDGRAYVAAFFGKTRLIDNVSIG